ncbi:hypothetical protein H1R20_g6785, partial [Candolleomyces eurysporus]
MPSASPFSQHLHTNHVPSSIEINHLRSLVDERQKLVDALDREITALTKRRDEHATFVKEHSALLSPIRRVPNDILSLIFLACLPNNSPARRLTKLSGYHPALVVSHVCHRWRELSFNTPLLWNVIDIHIPRPLDPREYRIDDAMAQWEGQMQAIYEMTQLWISRSASCPLTVSFSGGLSFTSYANFAEKTISTARQKMSCIVDAICDVSNRWKSAYLSVEMGNHDLAITRFFRIPPENLPILDNLLVNIFFTSPNVWAQSSVLGMTIGGGLIKAPSLRRLAVGRLWVSPLLLPVDWSKITEISLGPRAYSPDPSLPLSLLALCLNLTRCSLTFEAPSLITTNPVMNPAAISFGTPQPQGVAANWGPRLLPKLRTLEIWGAEPPVWFAHFLNLPSLRELFLICPVLQDQGGAIELIRRFGEGLTNVTLDPWCLTESQLLHVLERLPNVVSLRLVDDTFWHQRRWQDPPVMLDSVLEKLTPRYRHDDENGDFGGGGGSNGVYGVCLCPALEKFGCRFSSNVGFSEEAFVRFIASRRRGPRSSLSSRPDVSQLSSVVVASPSRKPDKTVREALEDMGVDLEDMVLITTYKAQVRAQVMSRMMAQDELDFGICNHDDYLSTVGPFKPTLGGWVL